MGFIETAARTRRQIIADLDLLPAENYCKTRAQGVAKFAVGDAFCSDETGDMWRYERIAAAPGYSQLPASAAPANRKLVDRNREDFDLVKSGLPRLEDWYAYGDGRDDTAAVQAALNSSEPIIYFPSKTFVCDALRLDKPKQLRSLAGRTGTGGGYPILKLADQASGDQLTVGPAGVLTVDHISFAGNRANQGAARSGIVAESRTDGVYSQCLIGTRLLIRDYAGWVAKIGTNRNAVKLLNCLFQGGVNRPGSAGGLGL